MRARLGRLCAAGLLAGVAALGDACVQIAGLGPANTDPSKQHCIDGIRDDGETDIDCGPPSSGCLACGGDPCMADTDCQSATCTNRKCAVPTCGDGVWDGYESSLDCGDPRGALIGCPKCSIGIHCWNGCNCGSGFCDPSTSTCEDGTPNCDYCKDGVMDNDETGVDCGGMSCPPCGGGGPDAGTGGTDGGP